MLSIAKLFLISVPITTFLYIFISDFSNSDLKNVERNNNLHGNFLHITDFHPDPHYMTNTTAKSRCHGHSSRQSKPKHMLKGIAGSWGATATICDSPMSLINATFEWLENNWKDKLDFVIWTGDNSRHDNDDNIPRSPQEIFELNQMITEKFLKTFANTKKPHKRRGPRFIPIVPSIGNNDIHPNNILPPGPNDMLKILHDIWDPFIPNNQRESFLRGGYYFTEVIPKKLLVISLNTLYFYNANTAVNGCKYPGQPGTDEIKWLNRILKKARKNNMKVYLTGHVAPRRKQYTRSCYKKYGKLALKYNDIILGHYYGHSNMDHFFFIGKNDNRSDEEVILAENREDCNLCDQTYAQQTNTQQTNAQQIMSSNLDKKNKGNTIDKYLDKLLSHYQKVPSGSPNDFAVVHINPSIIPVFYPALRIIKYNTTEVLKKKNEDEDSEDGEVEDDGEDDDEDEEDYYDDDNEEELLKKGKKGSRKRKPNPHSPSHTNTFLTPLGYTQYFINLTEANKYPNKTPEFQVEYTTWDDYNMKDLTVPSWIQLARKLANHGLKGSLWKKFREHLMVGTRSILKQKSRKIHHQDCIYTKCNAKGPEDYLVTEIES